MPKKEYAIASNINGGHRAIIQSGLYEQVVALDVMPEFLLKAVLAEDLDLMEQLGILECDEEDFALCSYICPSKTDFCTIIRNGLNMIEKEG
jgi:Na+-transporting NADH:ubiquinone oxidoreductase subunit A